MTDWKFHIIPFYWCGVSCGGTTIARPPSCALSLRTGVHTRLGRQGISERGSLDEVVAPNLHATQKTWLCKVTGRNDPAVSCPGCVHSPFLIQMRLGLLSDLRLEFSVAEVPSPCFSSSVTVQVVCFLPLLAAHVRRLHRPCQVGTASCSVVSNPFSKTCSDVQRTEVVHSFRRHLAVFPSGRCFRNHLPQMQWSTQHRDWD